MIYNQFQYLHQTTVRVELVIDHILIKGLVCLGRVLYGENVYGKSYRLACAEHHNYYYLYLLNEKDLLQTLRLQTSALSLNQHSFLIFHPLLLRYH